MPAGLSNPGSRETLLGPLPSSIPKLGVEEIDPVTPFAVAEAFAKVTLVVLAREVCEQLEVHTSGLSTIHSADVCSGAGDGSAMEVDDDHPAVSSVTTSDHVEPERLTEARTTTPGATGYLDVARSTA